LTLVDHCTMADSAAAGEGSSATATETQDLTAVVQNLLQQMVRTCPRSPSLAFAHTHTHTHLLSLSLPSLSGRGLLRSKTSSRR
jgi:hypothetical protein